jgi:nucleoside phosphorylase
VELPIAIVVALAEERRALQPALTSSLHWWSEGFHAVSGRAAGHAVVLIQAGIGREPARRALLAAAHWLQFCAAWSLGFAGSLTEQLKPGELVCASTLVLDDGLTGRSFPAAPAQAEVRTALSVAGIACRDGAVLTVETPLRTPEAKREAQRRTGAIAVDMEAAGVAEAARELGIPWLALKAVVDGVDDPLPEFIASCTRPRGDIRWRGVLAGLLASGNRRRTLIRLGRAARQAKRGLRRCLGVAVGVGATLTPREASSRI